MPSSRREILAKYVLDISKIALAVGVLTPVLAPGQFDIPKVVLSLIVGAFLLIIGYNLQPKE